MGALTVESCNVGIATQIEFLKHLYEIEGMNKEVDFLTFVLGRMDIPSRIYLIRCTVERYLAEHPNGNTDALK